MKRMIYIRRVLSAIEGNPAAVVDLTGDGPPTPGPKWACDIVEGEFVPFRFIWGD